MCFVVATLMGTGSYGDKAERRNNQEKKLGYTQNQNALINRAVSRVSGIREGLVIYEDKAHYKEVIKNVNEDFHAAWEDVFTMVDYENQFGTKNLERGLEEGSLRKGKNQRGHDCIYVYREKGGHRRSKAESQEGTKTGQVDAKQFLALLGG